MIKFVVIRERQSGDRNVFDKRAVKCVFAVGYWKLDSPWLGPYLVVSPAGGGGSGWRSIAPRCSGVTHSLPGPEKVPLLKGLVSWLRSDKSPLSAARLFLGASTVGRSPLGSLLHSA